MQLVFFFFFKEKKPPNGTWENCEQYIRNAKKEKILHTRNMDTWLLLYPTTKAWVSLKFYTTITLNIQFLNVFTEPAMHYRGAFQLCFQKKQKKVGRKPKWKGWSVFVQCWLFVLTQWSNLQRVQLPTEHRTAPIQRWGGGVRGGEARVCLGSEEEWLRDVENLWRGERRQSQQGFVLCLCMFLFKVIKIKTTTKKCTSASPEQTLTLSANVQDEIQTKFLLVFLVYF